MSTNATANSLVAGVEVKVNGGALDAALQSRIVEVRVEDNLQLPDSFEIRISDPDLTAVDRGDLAIGTEVEISLASKIAPSLKPVLRGEITSLEPEFGHDAVLVVRGYDFSHRMNRKKVAETYQQVTATDVARKVLQRNGLAIGKADSSGSVHPFIQQNNQTDWEFLWHLARKIDFEVVVEDKKAHFRKATTEVAGPTLKWGETLRSFKPRLTGVQQVEEVMVRGWDPKTKKEIVATAGSGKITPTAVIGTDPKQFAKNLAGGVMRLVNVPVDSQGDAQALATSVINRLAGSAVEGAGVAEGDPAIKAGTTVTVEGVGTKYSGKYKLTATTHVFRTKTGYETRFTIGGRSPRSLIDLMNKSVPHGFGNSVVIGIVTNNNDPEQRGRVRVKYPELSLDMEGQWAPVVFPNAGNERGMMMLPQVDDEVVIGFLHDQPEYPYILGSVYGGKFKPGTDLSKTDGSYGLRSPKDCVTDAKEMIKYTCGKDFVVTTKAKVLVTADGDVMIEAKGKIGTKATGESKVEGLNVTLKGSANVTVEAGAMLKLKGATIDISASGPVSVSGALIKLG